MNQQWEISYYGGKTVLFNERNARPYLAMQFGITLEEFATRTKQDQPKKKDKENEINN
jgi:hypothetical protein